MNNKNMKIIMSLLLLITIISLCTISLCVDPGGFKGEVDTSQGAGQAVSSLSNQIIGIIQIIGTAIAVVMLIWLAIKYISAAPSEKADIKKSATIYVVGAVLLFGAVGVLQIIRNFVTDGELSSGSGSGTGSPTSSNENPVIVAINK